MLLRQTLNDDGRGVDEPLNDPGQFGNGLIIKGSHILYFRNIGFWVYLVQSNLVCMSA